MRLLLAMCFALASCAYQTTEIAQTTETNKQQPALRAHLVPGTTYGNVALQAATINSARETFIAKSAILSCSPGKMKVSNTWPIGDPKPSEHSDAFLQWRELWTFEACGDGIDAEIIYMLHRKSGIINVKVSPVQKGQGVSLG